MAYLDSHGLQTLWAKIKTSFAASLGVSESATTVEIKLKDKAATPNDLSTITIPGASADNAGAMTAAQASKLAGIEAGANNYVHPTTSGNKHIPSGGTTGQILKYSADGTAAWADESTAKLYDSTGSNTDGAMTQKAATDALAEKQAVIDADHKLNYAFLSNTPDIPDALSDLTDDSTHRTVSDTEKSTWSGKQDEITSNNKLDYSLLDNTPDIPTELADLTADATHRLVTDTEKSTWNGKQNAITSDNKLDYALLDNAPEIPSDLADLQDDATHRVVTDTEKSTWDGKQDAITASNKLDVALVDLVFETAYNASTNKAATVADVEAAAVGVAKYKGAIASEAELTALANYKTGNYWVVSTAFTSASLGIKLDVGNMIFAKAGHASFTVADFDVIQADIEAIPDSEINALS